MYLYMYMCLHAKSLQLCPTLCSPPGSSVHGILQARILQCVAIALLQGFFPTRGLNQCHLCLLHWQVGSLPPAPPGKPICVYIHIYRLLKKGRIPDSISKQMSASCCSLNSRFCFLVKQSCSANCPSRQLRWSSDQPQPCVSPLGNGAKLSSRLYSPRPEGSRPYSLKCRTWAKGLDPRNPSCHSLRVLLPRGAQPCFGEGVLSSFLKRHLVSEISFKDITQTLSILHPPPWN